MTKAELKVILYARIERAFSNTKTVKTYKGGISRILEQLPIELFGNEAAVLRYKQLLSPSVKNIFRVVWPKIYEEMTAIGVPCVEPEVLLYRARMPTISAYSAEVLAMTSSFAAISTMTWGDLNEKSGQVHLGWIPLSPEAKKELRRLADYYWPGVDPEPTAPIIPADKESKTAPMSAGMIEDMVQDLHEGDDSSGSDRIPYQVYLLFSKIGLSLQKIDTYMTEINEVERMKKGEKGRARHTLGEAVKAIRAADKDEFNRLWGMALDGKRGDFFQKTPPVMFAPPPKPRPVKEEKVAPIDTIDFLAPLPPPSPKVAAPSKWRARVNVAEVPKGE